MSLQFGVCLPQGGMMELASIKRTATAFCSIGETHEQAMANIPEVFLGFLRQVGINTTTLLGSPATIGEGLAALEAASVQEVLLLFPDACTWTRCAPSQTRSSDADAASLVNILE